MRKCVLLALGSCLLIPLTSCAGEDSQPPSTSPAELSAAVLRSATYTSLYVEEGEILLENGIFEDTARRVAVYFIPEYAVGDLDQDGVPDAVVVLATNTGGSGTFHDLAVVLNRDGVPENTANFFLGDRVPVDRIRIVDEEIHVELTMHGPADPMCCPSLEVTRKLRLVGGELEEIDPPAGTPE
ncbi:MAG: hypothetical protein KAJ43_04560 [Gemmatimonadetes bacterium]|nr:hypothetical protein [Gemmatimonadota bacterium]